MYTWIVTIIIYYDDSIIDTILFTYVKCILLKIEGLNFKGYNLNIRLKFMLK